MLNEKNQHIKLRKIDKLNEMVDQISSNTYFSNIKARSTYFKSSSIARMYELTTYPKNNFSKPTRVESQAHGTIVKGETESI